jgi:hypothetical protein
MSKTSYRQTGIFYPSFSAPPFLLTEYKPIIFLFNKYSICNILIKITQEEIDNKNTQTNKTPGFTRLRFYANNHFSNTKNRPTFVALFNAHF